MTASLFRSFFAALLIPFTFACTGLSIFIANSAEMTGSIPMLTALLGVGVGVAALCLFLVQLPFLFVKKNWFAAVNASLFGCGFLLWLQANVFNWNFGPLDGSGVNWSAFRHLMILEIVVYLAVIGLVLWQRQWFSRYVIHLACLLIFMQMVPPAKQAVKESLSMRTKVAVRHLFGLKTTPQMYETAKNEITPKSPAAEPVLDPMIPAWKQYEITYDGFFDYSKEQNVVLIIPDAFSSEHFQRLTKKHPEVLEWFSDFNYFPKQKSTYWTFNSIPQMLTAADVGNAVQDFRVNNVRKFIDLFFSLWNSEGALQKTLSETGFQTRLYSWIPAAHHWDHRWMSNIRLKDSGREHCVKERNGTMPAETGIGQIVDLAVVRSLPIICKPADIDHFCPFHRFLRIFTTVNSSAFQPLPPLIKNDAFFVRIVEESRVTVTSEKPVLNVIHLKGPHRIYNFNESFEEEAMSGIEGWDRQAFAALRLIKRLIDDMKKANVYDNTLFVIAADHGSDHGIGQDPVADVNDWAQVTNPLLLLKRRNERRETMACHTDYTNMLDLTPTILDLVGLDHSPNRFSIFKTPLDVQSRREVEYEAYWAEKRQSMKLQVVNMEKGGGEDNSAVSSKIALKRSDLFICDGQLRWYIGDDPDTENNTCLGHNALVVMNPLNKTMETRYQGDALLSVKDTGYMKYWYSMGIINTKNVADGEYEVVFLLPKDDGSCVQNTLPDIVTVASGVASIR